MHYIENGELLNKVQFNEIEFRHWKFVGHILRVNRDSFPDIELTLTPDAMRDRGRLCLTWRCMKEFEKSKSDWSS